MTRYCLIALIAFCLWFSTCASAQPAPAVPCGSTCDSCSATCGPDCPEGGACGRNYQWECPCAVVGMAFCPLGPCRESICPTPGGECGRAQYDAWSIKHWLHSSCDMPQHLPYKLPEDGYYYFRPYHYTHVAIHQDFVSTWGGDRRNPYAFEVFDRSDAEELPIHAPSEPQGAAPPTNRTNDRRASQPPSQFTR